MILIVTAMKSEAKDLLKGFKEKTLFLDHKYYQGIINNKEVIILITGVGKTNSSSFLTSLLMKKKITKIINIGFVGAKGDFIIGEVVLVNKVSYGDVDVTAFTNYELGQIPKMPKYFNSDLEMLEKFKKVINKEVLLYTQDKFVLKSDLNNAIFDMEGASLYQVAYTFKTPIIAVKLISDIIGKKSQIENYIKFEENSSNIIKEIIFKLI